MKVGHTLVLHHSGVIYIADFRRCDRFVLCNISVLHVTSVERDESWKSGHRLYSTTRDVRRVLVVNVR